MLRTQRTPVPVRPHPRRAVSLQLDDDHVPLAIYTKQVDEPAEVGADLTPDEQNPPVFQNLVRVGLQPRFEDGFLMIYFERQLFVLREIAVRANAEDSHGRSEASGPLRR